MGFALSAGRTSNYFFWGNKTGCGEAKRELRATGLFPKMASTSRSRYKTAHKARFFRPAGTRVALPGTKRRSRKFASSLQELNPAFLCEAETASQKLFSIASTEKNLRLRSFSYPGRIASG
jgi:hypothetical protein